MLILKMKREYVQQIFADGEGANAMGMLNEAQQAFYDEMKRALAADAASAFVGSIEGGTH